MLNCNGMDGATKGEFYIRKNERKKKKKPQRCSMILLLVLVTCLQTGALEQCASVSNGLSDNSHSTTLSPFHSIYQTYLSIL